MTCYYPLQAYYGERKSNGKSTIVFKEDLKVSSVDLKLPCGRCSGCRLDRSRNWAIRCSHEAEMHENNCFITLTFSPKELSKRDNPWSLDVRDFQLFMKRLRKHYGNGIRFYHCGEYGSKNGRPHYHAILFGHDFDDKYHFETTKSGFKLYRSPTLEKLWTFGYSSIGSVTFESAAYVARYILKKIVGDDAKEHYQRIDFETGQVHDLKPEYTTMSRRPGIASPWLHQYLGDVYPKDYVTRATAKGVFKMRPPRFYDSFYESKFPKEFAKIQDDREDFILKKISSFVDGVRQINDDFTEARLEVKSICANLDIEKRLIRPLSLVD